MRYGARPMDITKCTHIEERYGRNEYYNMYKYKISKQMKQCFINVMNILNIITVNVFLKFKGEEKSLLVYGSSVSNRFHFSFSSL